MFTKIKLYLAGITAALLGLLAIYLRGRSDGADAVEHDIMEDRLESIQKAKEVEHEIDALDDTELSSRAKSDWLRNRD
jgi:hypothetical protein